MGWRGSLRCGRSRSGGSGEELALTRMKRTGSRKRRLAAIASGVLVLGGAAGAIAAGGDGKPHQVPRPAAGARRLTLRDVRAAAAYLGVPAAELVSELQSGKSLDEVAAATPGKSADGVVGALASEKRRRLNTLTASVVKHASSEASGHPKSIAGLRRLSRAPQGSATSARAASIASVYLGISDEKLESQLSGRTLAEVAAATPGKSVAGLVAALISPRRARLNAALGAHRMSQARAEAVNARLSRRVTALLNRRFP
jgi:hypothetical protein